MNQREKQIAHVKMVRGIDRKLAIESGEFHSWMPQSRTHSDKKKDANRKESRKFKQQRYEFA